MNKKQQVKNKIKEKTKSYFKKLLLIIKQPEISMIPGQVAFFSLLSLVPIITLSCYIAQFLNFNYEKIVSLVNYIVPSGGEFLVPNVTNGEISFGFLILLLWLFYLSSSACNTIILISNQIYGIKQSTWLRRRIKAMFMTLIVIILMIIILILQLYSFKIIEFFMSFESGKIIYSIIKLIKYPIILILLFAFLKLLYNFAPDRLRNNSHVDIGSIVTTIGWTIITLIYRTIANNMNTYNALYGGLAQIALLMVWLYFMSYIFVIGIALNHSDEVEVSSNK